MLNDAYDAKYTIPYTQQGCGQLKKSQKDSSAMIHKISQTNSSFHEKQCTTGKV